MLAEPFLAVDYPPPPHRFPEMCARYNGDHHHRSLSCRDQNRSVVVQSNAYKLASKSTHRITGVQKSGGGDQVLYEVG
jgi:hypothetical protein